jgi:monomeric isocitrate dehydrogenase
MATTDFHQRKQLQADAGLLFTTHIEGVLMKRMRPLGFTHQIKPYASKPLILCGGEE